MPDLPCVLGIVVFQLQGVQVAAGHRKDCRVNNSNAVALRSHCRQVVDGRMRQTRRLVWIEEDDVWEQAGRVGEESVVEVRCAILCGLPVAGEPVNSCSYTNATKADILKQTVHIRIRQPRRDMVNGASPSYGHRKHGRRDNVQNSDVDQVHRHTQNPRKRAPYPELAIKRIQRRADPNP